MPLVTANELERMGTDFRYELVEGRLVQMSPVGALHGVVTARLLILLGQHARIHGLGFVAPEVGFKLALDPDTVLAPDVAFVRQDRVPATGVPRGFWTGAPDLAVEVLSPEDRRSEIATKVADYLTSGVRLVWVVDPDTQTVTAHYRLGPAVTFASDDTLTAADVVPDFSCPVRDIFE